MSADPFFCGSVFFCWSCFNYGVWITLDFFDDNPTSARSARTNNPAALVAVGRDWNRRDCCF